MSVRAEEPPANEMDNRLYICWPTDDGFIFASKNDANVLVDDVFYLYQTYGRVSVSYTKDNVTQYDGSELKDTWIRLTLLEGGHLVVKHNETVLYDGYTRSNSDPGNTIKYKLGIASESLLISFLGAIPLAGALVIMKYSRKNVYLLGQKSGYNRDIEESEVKK